jgi:H+/Cl- antiporter ClcA
MLVPEVSNMGYDPMTQTALSNPLGWILLLLLLGAVLAVSVVVVSGALAVTARSRRPVETR